MHPLIGRVSMPLPVLRARSPWIWTVHRSSTGAYETSAEYDALNRVNPDQCPARCQRKYRPGRSLRYNRRERGSRETRMERCSSSAIAYNAEGAASIIAYGNDVMTRYAYDPNTFRRSPANATLQRERQRGYAPRGSPLAGHCVCYDLAGNVGAWTSRLPVVDCETTPRRPPTQTLPSGAGMRSACVRIFEYDPLIVS